MDGNSQPGANPTVAILAGGLATRLHPITTTLPKSMVSVAGRPFIAHQLTRLSGERFCDVVICAGHLCDQIEDFVGDGSAFGCRVRYSFDRETPLGTGGALLRALPLLGQAFLAMYGDSYLTEPFFPVWQAFLQAGKPALMTVLRNENRWDKSNVEFRDGEIWRYDKSGQTPVEVTDMKYIDYGLGCIRSGALAQWAHDERFDLASFYQAMVVRRELAGFEVKERFYEIGSLSGLAETELFLQDRKQPGAGE